MREHSRDKGRLEEIKQYALNVEEIIEGVTFDDFVKDIKIYYSVMKNIEVIGEAANMLSRDFKEKYTELPWRLIVKMRNILVHGYAQVSNKDLWQTASTDIKPMREQIEKYLKNINWTEWENAAVEHTEMDNAQYNNAIKTARKMKFKGYSVDEIAEITELTSEEILKL